jgi:cytochrome P450
VRQPTGTNGFTPRPIASRRRDPNPHVAFGFGPHFCIGAVLARLEGRILVEELLSRFGSVESAGPVVRTASPVIAGVRSAPLVFGSA